jgi:hypothetical protein
MPSLFVRFLLFLSSYFPLTMIFAAQLFWKDYRGLAWLSVGFGVAGILGVILLLWPSTKLQPHSIRVKSWARRDSEAMSYIVTYLLPFVALPTIDGGGGIGLGIFLFMLCVLYVNSGMIHINPTLNLAGWHIYEVVLENDDSYTLITRCRVRKGREIKVIDLDDNIYLEVKK